MLAVSYLHSYLSTHNWWREHPQVREVVWCVVIVSEKQTVSAAQRQYDLIGTAK